MILLFFLVLKDTISCDTTNIVHYSARVITYDLERSLVILNDSSCIIYRDIRLFSDSAYYHLEKDLLEAYGACDLRQKDDSIKGNYLKYNLATKKAKMEEGKTSLAKGFVEGKEIYWVSEKEVNTYDGKYTTCCDSPPHYYFYSPRMKVYLGDMVIAQPIFLYIYDTPFAVAPFWFVPISAKRKSGLLPFRAGNARDFGKFIRGFSYYYVISDYADITFQLDAMEKKGVMPQLEGVWNYSPYTAGTMVMSYIKEIDTGRKRYSIEGRNSSPYFFGGSNFNCDLKYVSDYTYRSDFAETTALYVDREITSQATLNRNVFGIRNSLTYERVENFADSTIAEKMPRYTLSTPSKLLLSRITYSFSAHYSRNRRFTPHVHQDFSGANLHTAPAIQQSILGLFNLSPRLDLDLAAYDKDTAGNRLPTRFGYSFGTSANTNLFRVFDLQFLGISGILHKVMPNINYTYTPDFDFGRFPSVSGIPNYRRTNSVSFGVSQEFEAKLGKKEEKRTIMRFNFSSGYNLLKDSLTLVQFSLDLPLNPFPRPIASFSSWLDGSINPYTKEYIYTITNGTAIKTDFLNLNLHQHYTRAGNYQIWFNGDLKPTRHWLISYSARYDWPTKKIVDYALSLSRDLHCWEGVFSFNQLAENWRYDFKVRIKAIPEVAIGRGLLGYIIE